MRENVYLKGKDIKSVKMKLLSDIERITLKDKSHESFCLDTDELSDVLDEASANIQASQELRFRNREIFYLKKLNQALERIESGTFGLCKECDAEVGYERLMARPTADLCINCKEESEMEEKNNFFQRKSKSLGKSLNDMNAR